MVESTGPLKGVRVLDMTRVVAGPLTGQILGDLGADVVKLERTNEGDDCRRVGPPWMKGAEGVESTYYQTVNRNKRCVTVDYANPQGAELIRQLAAKSDILLENYRTGTLARYGLGYEDLCKLNPRLIYCSLTGFGQTGPYSKRSGYDYLAQAMAGLMSVTGLPDGVPGAGPTRVGVPIADICTGLFGAIGVLGALNYRNETGKGQQIDVSLFDSQFAIMLNSFSAWFNGGVSLGRTGNDHPSAAPYGVYEVDDGFILIATFNDREFARLAEVLGHPEWADNDDYKTMGARVANRERLKAMVTEALKGRTKAEWVDIMNAGLVSCGPINEMADLQKDPQVLARELIVSQKHPVKGVVKSAANPLRFSTSPVDYRFAPPLTGEHTDEVLREWLDMDQANIERFRREGAV